jgi:alanyl-tRNA synthetase
VTATGQIGLLYILSEGSIGSGIRRIEALTGHAAREALRQDRARLEAAAASLRALPDQLLPKIEDLQARLRQAERENESLRLKAARGGVDALAASAREFAPGFQVAAGQLEASSIDELRQLSDVLRSRLGPAGVGVVAARVADKAAFVVTVGPDLVRHGLKAGDIAKQVAAIAGGSGGGRPDMAQAGGRDPEHIEAALAGLGDILTGLLNLGRKG